MEIQVQKDKQWIENYDKHEPSTWDMFRLHYMTKTERLNIKMNKLSSLDYIPTVQLMEHQLHVCETVLFQMNARAILADEVGLGKTIEACLILKELYIRNMIEKILIIAPASLLAQWEKELRTKFHIYANVYRKNNDFTQDDIVICSYEHAKKYRKQVEETNYDLLIVDEAHKLTNPKTINYQMMKNIRTKYCLLLTATPIKNQMDDVFYLATIVNPYLFHDLSQFQTLHKKEPVIFKHLLQQVMVRNRRKDHAIFASERNIKTVLIQFSEEERRAYDHIAQIFQQTNIPDWIYLNQLCSSREACYVSLQKNEPSMTKTLDMIAALPHHIKAVQLIQLLQSFNDEKIVIFTQYKATQYYLQWYLAQYGMQSIFYSGDMNQSRKMWVIEQFKQHVQVFIATDAASEGVNLQFAHILINYDLPWNPMRLEQRIGRVHRLGQENDVEIIHLVIEDTIESHILRVIYKKIHLFHDAIGKTEQILEQDLYEEL